MRPGRDDLRAAEPQLSPERLTAEDLESLVDSGALVVQEEGDLEQVCRRLVLDHVVAMVRTERALGAGHGELVASAASLARLAACWEPGSRAVARFDALHFDDWVRTIAALLEPDAGAVLLDELAADRPTDALARVAGIDDYGLERLYAAGLFTVRAIAHASARELAEVTGCSLADAHTWLAATAAHRG